MSVQAQPPRDTRSTAAATGRIAGVVTSDDATPRPLRRARVFLTGAPQDMPRSAITADDGSFVFEGLPPGRFAVGAEKPGYVRMNYGAARPNRPGIGVPLADRQTVRIAMRLPRGAVITGTVTNVDGLPAAGITVQVLARRFAGGITGDYGYVVTGPPATTDDRGVYRVFGLPAGEYFVAAQPTQGPGLPPGVIGSPVQMMSRGIASPRWMTLSQVFHPGVSDVVRASRVPVRAGEERSGIDIQLEYLPLAIVSGTAGFPAGFSPARVTLVQLDESARFPSGPVATADAEGRFQFATVPPGRYRVSARAAPPGETPSGRGSAGPNAQYAAAEVTVTGEDVEVALAPQLPVSISGRLVFDSEGPPPAELPVQLRSSLPLTSPGSWPMPPLVIDGARFRLDGIVPGSYRVAGSLRGVRAPIGRWWIRSIVAAGRDLLDAPFDFQQSVEDGVATLSDRASELSGRLLDAGGTPVPDLFVVVFGADRRTWFFNSRRIAGVRTDRDGHFAIRNLPPGEYRITAADLDPNEWFDPAVLERLMPAATRVTITGTEQQTVALRRQ